MNLDKDDVISMKSYGLVSHTTAKLEEIQTAIEDHMEYNLQLWSSEEGVPCEILRANGGGWLKGKVRAKFTIEFIPDEKVSETTDAVMGGHRTDL